MMDKLWVKIFCIRCRVNWKKKRKLPVSLKGRRAWQLANTVESSRLARRE